MKFLFISDLHIQKDSQPECTNWVAHFCKYISEHSDSETLYVFVLGDVIDKGQADAFLTADRFFSYIEENVYPIKVEFVFLPGNHDYCNKGLSEFGAFCERRRGATTSVVDFTGRNTCHIELDQINFILTDSMNGREHDMPGTLDIGGLYDVYVPGKTNVLLMHHHLLFENKSKNSGIDNAKDAIDTLHKLGINFVFQGHTHYANRIESIKDLHVIGVGSMGKDASDQTWMENEYDQFTVMTSFAGTVESIYNMLYRGGEKRFAAERIYPSSIDEYSDGTGIPMIDYPPVDGYIPRSVAEWNAKWEPFSQYFDSENKTSLDCACSKKTHILLVADAGIGKSIELKQLAFSLSAANSYTRPVFLSLRDYSGNQIRDFLNEQHPEYSTLNLQRQYLILDGFDEMDTDTSNKFKRELKKFIRSNRSTHICISLRSSFYPSAAEVFEDFATYQLLDIDHEQIDEELIKNKINVSRFREVCFENNLLPLLGNPLYLKELILIYCEKDTLPSAANLMENIMKRHLKKDCDKFEYAINIEEKTVELETALTRLAFAMQLMEVSHLDERNYQILLNSSDRELLKHSSLQIKRSGGYEFIHNVFKEYLAARYLSKLPFESVSSFVYTAEAKQLKASWLNVLGFVMQLRPSDELISWLFSIDPILITHLERDRATDDLRYNVLDTVLKQVEKDNTWLDRRSSNPALLSRFAQSPKALERLLTGIKNPVHFRALSAYLSVISRFEELYGNEVKTRQALMQCYENPETRPYEKKQAIEAISSLNLQTEEFAAKIVNSFYSEATSYERVGIYKYITESGLIDKYLKLILDGMSLVKGKWQEDENSFSEALALSRCLELIDTPLNVYEVITWLAHSEKKNSYNEGAFRNEAATMLNKAEFLYKQGSHELFDAVFLFVNDAIDFFLLHYKKNVIAFFKNTGTLSELFIRLGNAEIERKDILISQIVSIEPSSVDTLSDLYMEGVIDNEYFRTMIETLPFGTAFTNCAKLYESKTGQKIKPPAPPINYTAISQMSKQRFCDSLFDSSIANDILNDLLSTYGSEITIGELEIDYSKKFEYASGVVNLVYAMKRYGLEAEKAVDFFDFVDPVAYFKNEIMAFLDHGSNKCDVIFSEDQKAALYTLFHQIESTIDITKQYREDTHTIHYDLDLYLYLSLKRTFSWDSSNSIAEDLVEIPAFMFLEQDGNEKKRKYSLVEREIGKTQLVDRIAQAIERQQYITVLEELFYGCTLYKVKQGRSAAISFCKRTDVEDYEKRYAVEYLYEVFGANCILKDITPIEDEKLLIIALPYLKDISGHEIEQLILSQYQKSNDKNLLREMLLRNMPEGLKSYIKKSKEANCPGGDTKSGLHDLTDAIAQLNELQLVPLLCEAVEMLYKPGFVDNRFDSLYNALYKAFCNCAEGHFPEVSSALITLRDNHSGNLGITNFCNTTLEQLQINLAEKVKKVWAIADVAEIIKKIQITE